MKTKEQEAGELYVQARDAVRKGDSNWWMIANHINLMVNGTIDFDGPLWQDRELEPDKRRIHLDSFEDYLLKPSREGLGIPSLYSLHNVLITRRDGPPAIEILRKEIPDYDQKVELAKRKEELRKGPVRKVGGDGSNQHTKEKSKGDNVTFAKDSTRGNQTSYIIRRLLRDAPEIAKAYERGEYKSARAAGKAAGFIKEESAFEKVMKLLPKLTEKEFEKVKNARSTQP